MQLSAIRPEDLLLPVVHVWESQWLLLASGDFAAQDWNCMTVGWGSFGVMWGRPFAQVVVRPTRHTIRFIERFDSFTLCAFPEAFRPALSWLGSHSGRDGDKVKQSGLTPVASRCVGSPSFQEAELVVECRIIYRQDLDPALFLDPTIEKNYPRKDYHRVYFGEIAAAAGTAAWQKE
ncbi:MAG TPA: flavin reductase [Spirochaetia bacterium]|nr:flavin reductase [Spirochaetia bacterium]